MLMDKSFNREVNEDLNANFKADVEKEIDDLRMAGLINLKESEYLLGAEAETPKFYGLPKIHKGFNPFPVFRPIVSGCDSCCERISNFVDYHLKPMAQRNASFIRDTTDFLRKIKDLQIKSGSILVSADVTGLYTVIDHEEGAEACREALDMRSLEDQTRLPSQYIKRLVKLILQSNCFTFLGRFFFLSDNGHSYGNTHGTELR